MEAAVEEFLDFGPLEGDRLEVSLVVVVEERQSFSSICRRHTEYTCVSPNLLIHVSVPTTAQLQMSLDKDTRLGLTVQDDSHQRLVVLVEDLPEGEGLRRCVGQQSEQQADGVVRGQPFRMDEPVSTNSSLHTQKDKLTSTA